MSALLTPSSASGYIYTIPNNPDLITGNGCGSNGSCILRAEDFAFLYEAQHEFIWFWLCQGSLGKSGIDERRLIQPKTALYNLITTNIANVNAVSSSSEPTISNRPAFYDNRAIIGGSDEYSSTRRFNDVTLPNIFGLSSSDFYRLQDIYYTSIYQSDPIVLDDDLMRIFYSGIASLQGLWIDCGDFDSGTFIEGKKITTESSKIISWNSDNDSYEYTINPETSTTQNLSNADWTGSHRLYRYDASYEKTQERSSQVEPRKTSDIGFSKSEVETRFSIKYYNPIGSISDIDSIGTGTISRLLNQYKVFAEVWCESRSVEDSDLPSSNYPIYYRKKLVDISGKCSIVQKNGNYCIEASLSYDDAPNLIGGVYTFISEPPDPVFKYSTSIFASRQTSRYTDVTIRTIFAVRKPSYYVTFTNTLT